MIGTIERIKNSVLLKCSTLNDKVLAKTLVKVIDVSIYHFAEDVISMLGQSASIKENTLRNDVDERIKTQIIKKLKRKLFIDSLALQITNDSYIEDYMNGKLTLDRLKKDYLKELAKNKSSNQLNMTEDLNLDAIIMDLSEYCNKDIKPLIKENNFISSNLDKLIDDLKVELEGNLKLMINDTDEKYLNILSEELEKEKVEVEIAKSNIKEYKEEKKKEKEVYEGEEIMELSNENVLINMPSEESISKFEKYDDMTLFNKVLLSLNTKEEKLIRKESKLAERKDLVDTKLSDTNKNIEANIDRENNLSQRKLKLNESEVELNSKLSETEVIFLNMKPLLKGLNSIKASENKGGNK